LCANGSFRSFQRSRHQHELDFFDIMVRCVLVPVLSSYGLSILDTIQNAALYLMRPGISVPRLLHSALTTQALGHAAGRRKCRSLGRRR
jgi:hypothetical protein